MVVIALMVLIVVAALLVMVVIKTSREFISLLSIPNEINVQCNLHQHIFRYIQEFLRLQLF